MDLSADLVWLVDHLDDLAARTFQHIVLAAIGVGVGFLISFGLAIVAVRRRRTYAPILALSDVLYTIPSLAVFAALIAVTGISLVHRCDPARDVHAGDLRAQHRRRASTRSRPTSWRRPTGSATPAVSDCGASRCRWRCR